MSSTKTASYVILITITCLLGFGILAMKNQVQTLEKKLASINSDIQNDIKTIHVLKAEWSHLNNPSRLRKLASKHIFLNPVQPEQIINYSALPFEYEADGSRRATAQKNLANYAELKKLAKARQ